MQWMVKDYHKDQGPHRCAVNLDLKKAYDSVAQQFLFDFMVVMAFADIFIHWIKQVVTTAMLSLGDISQVEEV